jgi:signal transduction histidine kinase
MLADRGLIGALKAHVLRALPTVRLETDAALTVARFTPEIEAAVYFCCLEALQNASKYAPDAQVVLNLSEVDGWLKFTVRDDGPGFLTIGVAGRGGSGLQSMTDRLAALDGALEVASAPGRGTLITGHVPLRTRAADQVDPRIADQADASRSGANSALGR